MFEPGFQNSRASAAQFSTSCKSQVLASPHVKTTLASLQSGRLRAFGLSERETQETSVISSHRAQHSNLRSCRYRRNNKRSACYPDDNWSSDTNRPSAPRRRTASDAQNAAKPFLQSRDLFAGILDERLRLRFGQYHCYQPWCALLSSTRWDRLSRQALDCGGDTLNLSTEMGRIDRLRRNKRPSAWSD